MEWIARAPDAVRRFDASTAAAPISRRKSSNLARTFRSIWMGALPQPRSRRTWAAVTRTAIDTFSSFIAACSRLIAAVVRTLAAAVTVVPAWRPGLGSRLPGSSLPSRPLSATLRVLRRRMFSGEHGCSGALAVGVVLCQQRSLSLGYAKPKTALSCNISCISLEFTYNINSQIYS